MHIYLQSQTIYFYLDLVYLSYVVDILDDQLSKLNLNPLLMPHQPLYLAIQNHRKKQCEYEDLCLLKSIFRIFKRFFLRIYTQTNTKKE